MTKDVSKITDIAIKLNLITADDICQYSVVELVYKIINKVNEVIEVIGIQNDDIQYLLNDGMPEEVMTHFNKILNDGTLESFINQTVLSNINKKVDDTNKALQSKVTVNQAGVISSVMLSQEVKEQMTGGSVAVVGKNAVLNENIANGQVTREKTNFYDFSLDGNLVNEITVTKGRGYHSDGSLNETGTKAMITIYKSQLNFVNGGITITYNRACDFAFWGAENEYISGYYYQHVNDTQTADMTNIPVTADHVTITFELTNVNNIVICKKENYKAGLKGIYTDKQLELSANQLTGKIDMTQLGDIKIYPNGNLITRLNTIKGYYNTDGNYVENSQSVVIELEEGQVYKFNFNTLYSFWDENGKFIKGAHQGSLSGTTNTADFNSTNIPSNAKVLKMLIFDEDLDRAVISKTDYFKVGLKPQYIIDGLVASDKDESSSIVNPLHGKKAVFLGDSWCAGNAESGGTWASRIKTNNPSMTVTNYGLHGADWAQCSIHVLDHADKLAVMKEADYIIIEAYTNGLYGDVSGLSKPLGEINEFNYMTLEQIEALPNTYAKDLERALYRIATECTGKKIGVIFPYKAVAHLSQTNAFRVFRPQVLACCRKYNIPVFDNFDGCNIPSWSDTLRVPFYVTNDTVHLAKQGYDLITPPIEAWMKTL